MNRLSQPNKIHPATWWLLGLILIGSAIISKSILPLAIIIIGSVLSAIFLGKDWRKSLRFYIPLAVFVFSTRIIFRILFNFSDSGEPPLISLPRLEINLGFGEPVSLLGNLSATAFNWALVDGLRLASIVLAIAMATTISSPRNLLKSTPGVLYEIAAAVSMAINLVPQIASSFQRVKQSRELRGRSPRLSALKSLVIPTLEDTIESSMNLAASMSARGFGRTGQLSRTEQRLTRAFSLLSLVLLIFGLYLVLTVGLFELVSLALLGLGLILAVISLRITSRKQIRTSISKRSITGFDCFLILLATLYFLAITLGWLR